MKRTNAISLVLLCLTSCSGLTPQGVAPSRSEGEVLLMFTAQRRLSVVPGGCSMSPAGGVGRETVLRDRLRDEWGTEPLQLTAGTSFQPLAAEPTASLPTDSGPETLVDAWNKLGLAAFHPSARDFALGIERLQALERKAKFPFVASNVVERSGKPLFQQYLEITWRGVPVLVIGVADPAFLPVERKGELRVEDPLGAVSRIISERGRGRLVIVLSSLGTELEKRLRTQIKGAHVILSANEDGQPVSTDPGIRSSNLFARPDLAGRSVFVSHLRWTSLADSFVDITVARRLEEELAYARAQRGGAKAPAKWDALIGRHESKLREISGEGIRHHSENVTLTSELD